MVVVVVVAVVVVAVVVVVVVVVADGVVWTASVSSCQDVTLAWLSHARLRYVL